MNDNEKYDLYNFNDNSIEGKLLLIWKKLIDIEHDLSNDDPLYGREE